MSFNRRQFFGTAVGTAAAWSFSARSYGRIYGANSPIRCAIVGLNGRGMEHLAALKDSVVAVCDCDAEILRKKAADRDLLRFQDFRKLLEDTSLDAVSIATPNHLHSWMAIQALMAGKHVYVEKPVSHNVWEGRQLVAAEQKYQKIVQCGTQSRSSPSLAEALAYVRSGKLGAIKYALGTCYKPRKSIGKLNQPLKVPAHIDYDLWCGPAEKKELYRPQFHYDWHWDFNTGNGDMGNQGIHQMDIARWFLGYQTLSPRVLSIGGRVGYEDAGNTPNSQIVLHDYPTAPLIFETRGLPKSKAFQVAKDPKDWERNMDSYRGSRVGVLVQCEQGYVVIPNYTSATVHAPDGAIIEKWDGGGDHFQNFLDAVASNDRRKQKGPILEGHLSSALCHTGGLSHQCGTAVHVSEIDQMISHESDVFQNSWQRLKEHLQANEVELGQPGLLTYGANLEFDVAAEQVTNNATAQAGLTREYRAGFEIAPVAGVGG